MAHKRKLSRGLYKKLVALYPRAFRDRFGESMEQTFDDLDSERHDNILQICLDTGLGAVREHIADISRRKTMSDVLKSPRTAAIAGLLLFLPGAILVTLMALGVEPPLGPLRPYLDPPDQGPHLLGSLLVLGVIVILPAAAVLINVAATEGNVLKNVIKTIGLAAIIGLIFVLPFVVLQLVNARHAPESFPTALFVFLWALPLLFFVILVPFLKTLRPGKSLMANPVTLIFRVAFLVLIAVMWAGLVNDQMPCFLGVPNCD